MTPAAKAVYRCTDCGAEQPRWAGRCDGCGEWNTLVEEHAAPARRGPASGRAGTARNGPPAPSPVRLSMVSGSEAQRWRTGLDEFDFVLGGGLVPGAVVLIGGEPGIGKSTLLLQVAASLHAEGHPVLYVSAEESPLQVKLRADRLADGAGAVDLLAETVLESILAAAANQKPAVLVIDSVQTIFTEALEGAPGNVGQVRECAAQLMRFAKASGTAVLMVGHVTKGGGIAGPKTLEHIVDTVLYFEGEQSVDHRILRATKNRFGSVDEIGVFRMTAGGLVPVANASALFLGDRAEGTSGSAVTALIEGTRPLLVEIQALAAKAGYGTPQRVTTGFDSRRLALLLAVLERRAGLAWGQLDVFVNVAGGLRVDEPGADLAVAAALASSTYDRPLPPHAVFLGEVGLGGEVRPIAQVERRLAEAANLGMREAFLPKRSAGVESPRGLRLQPVTTVRDLFDRLFT